MNFFKAQDQARRTTRRLVAAYVVATLIIVAGITALVAFALYSGVSVNQMYTPAQFTAANAGVLSGTAGLTTLFILGASLFKTSQLSSGGGRVAQQLGGTLVPTDVSDPLRRRLRNVVEEMAIASGVPVPEIYVLEAEAGINAFAAGYTNGDAAIAVTRGTLELLDRDELQGVVAHEFSHIMNGDMRLNIRLMGVLFGILVLGLIGRMIIRGGYHTSIVSSRRDRGAPAILVIGIGLAVLGGIGVFFGRLIKAGVSRQREYLADASAVQFTRQSEGIANALKKIGGYEAGSYITAADPEEVSHMLFGSGAKLSGLFATHPPLADRIRALDPDFDASQYPRVERHGPSVSRGDSIATSRLGGDITSALASGGTTVLPDSIAETVGRPESEHVGYARRLRESIPQSLYDAAHSPQLAYLLCIALVLDRDGGSVDRQLALAAEQLGGERTRILQSFYADLAGTDAEFRLPLLEIAFPALKRRPTAELSYLVELTTRMIEIDGHIDFYEYCFYRFMMGNLGQATDPRGGRAPVRARRGELQAAAVNLLRVLADYGHDNDADRAAAFAAGLATLGPWAQDQEYRSDRDFTVAMLDHSLDILLGLNSGGQESLMRAISATAAHDGKLAVAEAELIRAVCAVLNYPLPPILVRRL